jgi:VWFA-related protein
MTAEHCVAPFLFACALLYGQAPPLKEVAIRTRPYTPPSAILRANANLVETGLMVRDSGGRSVSGLQAADFGVLDNGVPRQIVAFSELRPDVAAPSAASTSAPTPSRPVQSAPPRFVTFFFDDLHVPSDGMLFVKQGARRFIAEGIAPSDRLSIVTASGQGDLDFTTDAKRFAERLEHLGSHVRPPIPGYCGVGSIESYIFLHNLDGQIIEQAIGAAMKCTSCSHDEPPAQCRAKAYGIAQSEASATWEQMSATSQDTLSALGYAAGRLSQVNGTRVLVLTSYGFLLRPGVPPELQRFVDGALRSNIVVHAIGAQGLTAGMSGPKGLLFRSLYQMPMENIAEKTGGHFFKDSNDLAGAMRQAADSEVSYVLGFSAGDPDGRFHPIKIRFKQKNSDQLEYRSGYFSPQPKAESSPRSRLDDAVLSRQALGEIPMSVSLAAEQPQERVIPVSVRITLDIYGLQFAVSQGRHVQQIAFVVALLDPDGGFVTGKESIMDLALTDEKLASLRRTGLTAVATLDGRAGALQVRVTAREGMRGRLAAQTIPIEVRAR